MKTIEERAKEYASKKANISSCAIYNDALASIYMEGYIAGAKEQKQIDRIHFKKWYCKKICYKRNKCQSSSIMCYRLGQIVKEIENI